MGRTLPANEHTQDPRDFYASDSPVLNNSDSDQEVYESAEDFAETLETEDRGGEQVGSSSTGIRVSISRLVCIRHSETAATARAIPGPSRAICTACVTTPTTFPAIIAPTDVVFAATS
jgi:hypothetical protein